MTRSKPRSWLCEWSGIMDADWPNLDNGALQEHLRKNVRQVEPRKILWDKKTKLVESLRNDANKLMIIGRSGTANVNDLDQQWIQAAHAYVRIPKGHSRQQSVAEVIGSILQKSSGRAKGLGDKLKLGSGFVMPTGRSLTHCVRQIDDAGLAANELKIQWGLTVDASPDTDRIASSIWVTQGPRTRLDWEEATGEPSGLDWLDGGATPPRLGRWQSLLHIGGDAVLQFTDERLQPLELCLAIEALENSAVHVTCSDAALAPDNRQQFCKIQPFGARQTDNLGRPVFVFGFTVDSAPFFLHIRPSDGRRIPLHEAEAGPGLTLVGLGYPHGVTGELAFEFDAQGRVPRTPLNWNGYLARMDAISGGFVVDTMPRCTTPANETPLRHGVWGPVPHVTTSRSMGRLPVPADAEPPLVFGQNGLPLYQWHQDMAGDKTGAFTIANTSGVNHRLEVMASGDALNIRADTSDFFMVQRSEDSDLSRIDSSPLQLRQGDLLGWPGVLLRVDLTGDSGSGNA